MMNPCYGCLERAQGCHGTCARYAHFRKPLDAAAAQRLRDGDIEHYTLTTARQRRRWLNSPELKRKKGK